MPGSRNPWAQELKARRPMKKPRPDKGNTDSQINTEFNVDPSKAALADKAPLETGENCVLKKTDTEKEVADLKATNQDLPKMEQEHCVKGEKPHFKRPEMLSNQPVGITEKPTRSSVENPPYKLEDKQKIPHPPPPKPKVKALPQEVGDTKSLYQDARSQLRRVVTKQLSRKEEPQDGEDMGPIDQLIRQGSLDPKKSGDFSQEDILSGILSFDPIKLSQTSHGSN